MQFNLKTPKMPSFMNRAYFSFTSLVLNDVNVIRGGNV